MEQGRCKELAPRLCWVLLLGNSIRRADTRTCLLASCCLSNRRFGWRTGGGGKLGSNYAKFPRSSGYPRAWTPRIHCLNLRTFTGAEVSCFLFFVFFSLVHHPTFVQGLFSELYITQITQQLIRAHPLPSPLVLRMAGPILWNFKMIPCPKYSPVGWKLNIHLCGNLNSTCLVCEMLLSHYP